MRKRLSWFKILSLVICVGFGTAFAGEVSTANENNEDRGGREAQILDNDGLIKLVEAGVPLDVILNMLKTAAPRLSASHEEIIRLTAACGKEKQIAGNDLSTLLNKVVELAKSDQTRLKSAVDIALVHFLNSESEDEYEKIMRKLQREGRGAVAYLLNHCEEESERKRSAVLDALRRFGDKSPAVRRAVRLMLTDRSKIVRAMAAKAVADLSVPETFDELLPMLKSAELYRDGVLLAMGYLGDERAVEPLAEALTRGPEDETRIAAAFSLGQLGARKPIVLNALRQAALAPEKSEIRNNAARSLALLGDENVVPIVIRAFQRFRDGRADILRNLRSFKKAAAVEFLIPLVDDDGKDIRAAATETLHVLLGENYGANREKWQAYWFQIKTRPEWIDPEEPKGGG